MRRPKHIQVPPISTGCGDCYASVLDDAAIATYQLPPLLLKHQTADQLVQLLNTQYLGPLLDHSEQSRYPFCALPVLLHLAHDRSAAVFK
jgi:hypothetical protein